jgi:hypothetical protein
MADEPTRRGERVEGWAGSERERCPGRPARPLPFLKCALTWETPRPREQIVFRPLAIESFVSVQELCRGDRVRDRQELGIVTQQVEHLAIEP